MDSPDVDLPKLTGAAGSAVGLIISTAVLLSRLTSRYTAADEWPPPVSPVVPGSLALGAAALFLALAADAVAVGSRSVENRADRHAVLAGAGDIDEVNGWPPQAG